MKALATLLIICFALAGCATQQMKDDDEFLWNSGSNAAAPADKAK